MPKVYKYRIHPAIGVARVGGSAESFDGPEVPFQEDFVPPETPAASGHRYKDAAGQIRRQAAIFHIYEFEYPNTAEAAKPAGKPSNVRAITANNAKITWTIKLANLKSLSLGGTAVPITPGAVTVAGVNQPAQPITGTFANGSGTTASVLLGEMATDALGRLRALAGHGKSDNPGGPRNLPSFDANPGWFDEMADGPVKATVDFTGKVAPPGVVGPQNAASAWLVTGAPDFAHAIEHVISLWDVAYAIAVGPTFRMPHDTKPSFTKDIYPILHKAAMAHWTSRPLHALFVPGIYFHVFEDPKFGDAAFRAAGTDRFNLLKSDTKTAGSAELMARTKVFDKLRPPSAGGPATADMPLLNLALTGVGTTTTKLALLKTQYKQLKQWREGEFHADWTGVPAVVLLKTLAAKDRPRALDEAHMRSIVGGAFGPGIEVGKNVTLWSNWSAPFRIDDTIPPGTLTATLAMPWQADFEDCAIQDGAEWWPSHRPIDIVPGTSGSYTGFTPWSTFAGMIDMANRWNELGFISQASVGGDTLYRQQEPPTPP